MGRSVGNYVLERPLAQGGMAVVFVARHPELGREVAVKFLSPRLHGDLRLHQRFLQEARVTATLRHPNIVEIYDFGELDGRTYYTMELLSGRDLLTEMRRRGRFTHEEVATYLEQICEALDAAHRVDVVHRDLKPANVFVLDDQSLRLKLMDFGIAKVNDAPQGAGTLHGQILGTPTHMAPEQALGQLDRIGPSSDIYSVGVIAYEMLSGRPPFSSDSDLMLLSMHIRDPVPSLSTHAPWVPPPVAEIVERCLSKNPADRPQAASELAKAFRAASRAGTSARPARERPARAEPAKPHAERLDGGTGKAPLASTDRRFERLAGAPTVHEPEGPAQHSEAVSAEPVAFEPEPERRIQVTESDARVLDRLLAKMQRRADFPSFLTNVTEISRKADADSQYSACHLSESILKDFALTAKLLRMVNTLYANRFGGKVFSVNQAVVILGFDSVRSIALGVSVFRLPGQSSTRRAKNAERSPGRFDDQLADSAVSSLVSGEIARLLAPRAGLKETELAMMCAIFRNLGQHLVMEYLPDEYSKIQRLCASGSDVSAAATRVLGMSLSKIGLGVAEQWRLPTRMRAAIATTLGPDDKIVTEEDRLSALSKLANDLCHAVATGGRESWESAVESVLARNRKLLSLEKKEVVGLLGTVCKSFEDRYSALFGPYNRRNRFLANARTVAGQEQPSEAVAAPPLSSDDVERLEDGTSRITDGLASESEPERLLADALRLLAETLAVPRAVLFVLTEDRQHLVARAAWGPDDKALTGQLKLPFSQRDVFSLVVKNAKSVTIEDALGPSAMRRVPQCYYESIGSPSFAIYPCASRGYRTAALLVDVESPRALPSSERVAKTSKLREIVAKIAERSV